MFPRLIDIPLGFATIPINTYGVMVMAGFLAGVWAAGRRGRARGIAPELISDLSVWLLLGGLLGARVAYVVFYNQFNHRLGRWEYDFGVFDLRDGGIHPLGAAAGFAAGVLLAWWRTRKGTAAAGVVGAGEHGARRQGAGAAPGVRRLAGGVILMLGPALVGGRVLHLVMHRAEYNFKLFAIWEGGIVFYGGFVGALAAGIWFLVRRRAQVLATCDAVAPSLALGMIFGRIGCFLKGCCFGSLSNAPWAVAFPRIDEAVTIEGVPTVETTGSPAFLYQREVLKVITGREAWSRPVHATQLYESAAMIALTFLLSWYWRRSPRPGRVLAVLGVGYGAWRFVIEFLRGDPHPLYWGLHVSQAISLGVVAVSAALWALVPATAAGPGGASGGDGAGRK